MILALAGGVGGAKLAHGLAMTLPPHELCVAVNTGDDFQHLGLHISPDLDTVMYTIAGLADRERGWGVAGETWAFMGALERLGAPTWFRLGDQDLATHVERTRRLREGQALHVVTQALCERLRVAHSITPVSNEPVRTFVRCAQGAMEFQRYFVRERAQPAVSGFEYRGADAARPAPPFAAALQATPCAVVICPSNPYLSIAPILAIPGVRDRLAALPKVIAVSPIVAGQAIKGPAAKIMRELGVEPSAVEIARWYRGIAKVLVIDRADAAQAPAIEALGLRAIVTDTVMRDDAQRARLASECLALANEGCA